MKSNLDIEKVFSDRVLLVSLSVSLVLCIYGVAVFFLNYDSSLESQTVAFRESTGYQQGAASQLFFFPLVAVMAFMINLLLAIYMHGLDQRMSRLVSISAPVVILTTILVASRIME